MDFKLVMVFVDEDRTEAVLDAARAAGATGATIISSARGQGLKPAPTFLGFEFLAARSVILALVEASRSPQVMQAVAQAGQLDESANSGIAIEIPVTGVLGLQEHVRYLEGLAPGA